MDVMRNRIRPILYSLRQWRCRFSEELTEVEIRPGDYHCLLYTSDAADE